ncbi:hypothetical protein M8745_19780, partial [Lutimaribacter sp. EGI FJ00014]|nr:hypothetical protein [Lutimaribacter sp. EGI FJ00014]
NVALVEASETEHFAALYHFVEAPTPQVTRELEISDLDRIGRELGEDARSVVQDAVLDALDQGGITVGTKGEKLTISAPSEQDATATIDLANGILATAELSTPFGSYKGINVSGKPGTILDARVPTVDMQPGPNFVPHVGMVGELPLNADNQLVLGNGRVVRTPDKPLTRRHILNRLEQTFGLKIYTGKVKGAKTRL